MLASLRDKWRALIAFGAVLALMAAVACQGPQGPPGPAAGVTPLPTATPTPTSMPTPTPARQPEELRLALTELGNEALDPIRGPANNAPYVRLIYDELIGVDLRAEELSKETGIVRDWEVSDDGRVYTFDLRQGVKFHNGDELTAEDVKFSLERLGGPLNVSSVGQQVAKNIESIAVEGPNRLRIRLKKPWLFFLYYISSHQDIASAVVPKRYVEAEGPETLNRRPVGSGPYKFAERQVGAFIRVEQAFPTHFAGGQPRFRQVTVLFAPETATHRAMLIAGQVDFTDIRLEEASGLKERGFGIFPFGRETQLRAFFQLQREGEATLDLNLRKALSYAINREELNKFVLGGYGRPAGNPLHGQLGGVPLQPDPYDPEKAKEFLKKSTFGSGAKVPRLQIQVTARPGWPHLVLAAAIQDYWKAIGIESTIIYRDYGSMRAEWAAGTLAAPAVILVDFNSQEDWLARLHIIWGCGGTVSSACDPGLERLLAEWDQLTEEEAYKAQARVVERYMRDNYIKIPIVSQATPLYAANDKIPKDFNVGTNQSDVNVRGMVFWPSR